MKSDGLFLVLDLVGTFAFASSGAAAARQRGLDLFGVAAIAYVVACGGGIVRDLCIGAIPPAGLSNWRYVVVALFAAALAVLAGRLQRRLEHPVLLFDAMGLAFFAVSGAQKASFAGHNMEVAVLLGMTTAVGGGVIRDVLLDRVPVISGKGDLRVGCARRSGDRSGRGAHGLVGPLAPLGRHRQLFRPALPRHALPMEPAATDAGSVMHGAPSCRSATFRSPLTLPRAPSFSERR